MAQQQQRNQTGGSPKTERSNGGSEPSGPPAPVALPFALWSNMANMQREFFSSIVEASDETKEAVAHDIQSAELQPDAVLPAVKAERGFLLTAAEVQREIASFFNARLAKNQSWLSKAGQISDMQHFFQLQGQWFADATRDYTAEYGKLVKIVSRKG